MAVFGVKVLLSAALAVIILGLVTGSRYKSCNDGDGCCKHEFCAYDMVCYPITKCHYGCPDGECIEDADGEKACLPQPPCASSKQCQPGHACTKNYNLGYSTCQYDLSIGSTLCEVGDSNVAADTWQKRSFLARWRGKAAFRPKSQKGPN